MTDARGSVIATTAFDSDVSLSKETEFDAWGKKLAGYSALSSPRHGFAGAEQDEAAGTYTFGARAYDPTLRRWVSADPLLAALPEMGAGAGEILNLYAYGANNPVSRVDLTGFEDVSVKEIATAWFGLAVGVVQGAHPVGMLTEPIVRHLEQKNPLEYSGTFQANRGAGQLIGGTISLGSATITGGGAGGVSAGSGGTLAGVTVPAVVVTAVKVANGTSAVVSGGQNMEAGGKKAAAQALASKGSPKTPKSASSEGAKGDATVRGKAEGRSAEGRKSFESGRDAQEQLEDIEAAQQQNRQRGQPNRIESKTKSEQRMKNELDRVKTAEEAEEEFD